MRNLTIFKCFVLVLICFVCGCSVVDASTNKETKIEWKDGINAEEAALIATFYVQKDDYYQKYYSISQLKVKESVLRKKCWLVEFSPNIKGVLKVFYPLQVSVDKDTGEIRGVGTTK